MNLSVLLTSIILNVSVFLTETGEYANYGFQPLKKIIIALVIGLIVGLIYALMLKGQLTSVYKKDSAADYTRPGSFNVTGRQDVFLYSKTDKTPKPKQN